MTKNALISLLHLSHEIITENKDKASGNISVNAIVKGRVVRFFLMYLNTFFSILPESGLHIPVVVGE